MPGLAKRNELKASVHLPGFYWSGETDMHCLRQVITQTLVHGYAHHIQRLMVTGLFALMLGVIPREVHEWYLAVYVDAVEWVELPNTLCMSQFADGGILASKPYIATGKYIKRMSNYCDECPYKPDDLMGDNACPFTTLYWDFLIRHETLLGGIPRMGLQLRNLGRLPTDRRTRIRRRADDLRESLS
jgi:deoxyribodipyrimidine photolyase-related protein